MTPKPRRIVSPHITARSRRNSGVDSSRDHFGEPSVGCGFGVLRFPGGVVADGLIRAWLRSSLS